MTDLTTRWPAGHPGPDEQPDPPDRAASRPADPAGAAPADPAPPGAAGVQLSRLLALVRLSPAQGLEIAAGVLSAVLREPLGDPSADEVGSAGRFRIAGDGRVSPAPTTDGRGTGGPAGLPARGAVLADVAAATRLPDPDTEPEASRLRDELDAAVADLRAAGVAAAARRVQAATAGLDRPAVCAELGALVRTVGTMLGPGGSDLGNGTVGGAARAGRPARDPRAGPAGSTPATTGSVGRRIGAWLLSILVLAGVVALEVVFLRDDLAADIDQLLDAGRSGGEPAAAEETPEPALPEPAPPAAGEVAGIDLRPLAACEPGAPCTVRVLVRVVPAAEPQVVTWSYRLVDRCTGAASSAPGGTVTVPPRADRAAAVGVVPLPAVPAVAVFAVTAAPAVAASAPVRAGSCPSGDGG